MFIVLEGIDGSGSTTQGDLLTEWLRERGRPVHFTHEPSDGPAGMLIRLALSRRLRGASGENHTGIGKSAPTPADIDSYTLALLYAADRMDHINAEILPNLKSGRIVISDRYLLSSLAYQGMSVDENWVLQLNSLAPPPDLCIYLDVPVECAQERMKKTRWTRDLFEDEPKLLKIRDRYLRLVANPRPEYGRIVTLDSTRRALTVSQKIRELVKSLLDEQAETKRDYSGWPAG